MSWNKDEFWQKNAQMMSAHFNTSIFIGGLNGQIRSFVSGNFEGITEHWGTYGGGGVNSGRRGDLFT